jgi:hypothetical protein
MSRSCGGRLWTSALAYENAIIEMRTTLNLDDDVYEWAKSLAEGQRIPVGKAVSYLARRGAHRWENKRGRPGRRRLQRAGRCSS